jgi:hypothetical protein
LADGEFKYPYGAAVSGDGNIYVTDSWNYRVQVFGAESSVTVEIDIKPEGNPNTINFKNPRQVITVAILTIDAFDATTVDHTTVSFEGAAEMHTDKKTGEARRHEEDVDGDGDTDLVFHFRLRDTDLTPDSTEGALMGETYDGVSIQGTDTIHSAGKIS